MQNELVTVEIVKRLRFYNKNSVIKAITGISTTITYIQYISQHLKAILSVLLGVFLSYVCSEY